MANFKDIMAMCLDGEAMLPSLRRWVGECPIVCVWGFGLQVVRQSVGVSHG